MDCAGTSPSLSSLLSSHADCHATLVQSKKRPVQACPLIWSLLDRDLIQINQLYDDRASMENEIKADKAGLLLPRRRKKQLNAQEAFVLLTDLAHNILAWTRPFWAAQPAIGDIGIYSIVNKIMPIT